MEESQQTIDHDESFSLIQIIDDVLVNLKIFLFIIIAFTSFGFAYQTFTPGVFKAKSTVESLTRIEYKYENVVKQQEILNTFKSLLGQLIIPTDEMLNFLNDRIQIDEDEILFINKIKENIQIINKRADGDLGKLPNFDVILIANKELKSSNQLKRLLEVTNVLTIYYLVDFLRHEYWKSSSLDQIRTDMEVIERLEEQEDDTTKFSMEFREINLQLYRVEIEVY